MRRLAIAAAFTAVTLIVPMSGLAQPNNQGPTQLPAEGGNNTVLPTIKRPDAGWPDIPLQSPTEFCGPNQHWGILRISRISDRSTFDQAVKDNEAWYRRFGISSNRQVLLPVILPSLTTGQYASIPDIAVTLHINPPGAAETQRVRDANPDAAPAWAAFTAKYRASSTIIEAASVCVPRDLMPPG